MATNVTSESMKDADSDSFAHIRISLIFLSELKELVTQKWQD